MIIFNQVSKRYDNGQEAVKNLSFHLAKGEMAFLTGHSGAGKSSVLKLIALIERSSKGQIIIDDRHLNKTKTHEIPFLRRRMGLIFQNPHLLSDRRVFDNVALPLIIAGYPNYDINRRVRAALDKVGLLNKENCSPTSLSTGEQQRVSIARAIVHKPRLLLADEPTGNLDPKLSAEIMHLFEQFNQVGVSVLVASHDLNLIARMQHRILTLNEGELI